MPNVEGNEIGKKKTIDLIVAKKIIQTNSFALAAHFFVLFCRCFARLQRETS